MIDFIAHLFLIANLFHSPPAEKLEFHLNKQQERCLLRNVWHESRNQQLFGKYAVAQVTLNRASKDGFPSDVCSVVSEPKQFSWYAQIPKKQHRINIKNKLDEAAFKQVQFAVDLAVVLTNLDIDFTKGATFYHRYDLRYSKSKDFQRYEKLIRIDDHVFYKCKTEKE